MAKRFTDTNKYKKPFIRGLQGAYKLLWDYLYHDCDHAGIWIVDFEIAQIYIGDDMKVCKEDALKHFNKGEKRIVEIDNKSKWFIPSFIDFQYGKLTETNRAHNSVILILKKYKLYNKGLIRPLQGCKDKDKDKDMDMVKDRDEAQRRFNEFFEKMYEQVTWFEHIQRSTKIKVFVARKKFYDFYLELIAKEDIYRPEMEYKSHFVNWLKINEKVKVDETVYPGKIKFNRKETAITSNKINKI
jgi:hypothetical protein